MYIVCIPESFNTNISNQLSDYSITFVSQRKNRNSKGDFALKTRFEMSVWKISGMHRKWNLSQNINIVYKKGLIRTFLHQLYRFKEPLWIHNTSTQIQKVTLYSNTDIEILFSRFLLGIQNWIWLRFGKKNSMIKYLKLKIPCSSNTNF